MIVTRVIEPLLKGEAFLILAGISVCCFLIFFPAYFTRNKVKEQQTGIAFGVSLAIAVLMSILFRTLNSTLDLSVYGWYQIIGWILGIAASLMLYGKTIGEEKVELDQPREGFTPSDFGFRTS